MLNTLQVTLPAKVSSYISTDCYDGLPSLLKGFPAGVPRKPFFKFHSANQASSSLYVSLISVAQGMPIPAFIYRARNSFSAQFSSNSFSTQFIFHLIHSLPNSLSTQFIPSTQFILFPIHSLPRPFSTQFILDLGPSISKASSF